MSSVALKDSSLTLLPVKGFGTRKARGARSVSYTGASTASSAAQQWVGARGFRFVSSQARACKDVAPTAVAATSVSFAARLQETLTAVLVVLLLVSFAVGVIAVGVLLVTGVPEAPSGVDFIMNLSRQR